MSKVVEEFALQLERVEQAESQGNLRRRQIDSLGRLAREYARVVPSNDPILAAMQYEIGKRHRPTPLHKLPGSCYWAIEANHRGRWERVFDNISALPTARIKAHTYGKNNNVAVRVVEGSCPENTPNRTLPPAQQVRMMDGRPVIDAVGVTVGEEHGPIIRHFR